MIEMPRWEQIDRFAAMYFGGYLLRKILVTPHFEFGAEILTQHLYMCC